jgi:hypothetical protein
MRLEGQAAVNVLPGSGLCACCCVAGLPATTVQPTHETRREHGTGAQRCLYVDTKACYTKLFYEALLESPFQLALGRVKRVE